MRLEYDVSPVANLDIGERFHGTIVPTDTGCARRVVELHSNTVREGLNNPLYAADIMYETDLAIRHETFRDIELDHYASAILHGHAANLFCQRALGLEGQGRPQRYTAYPHARQMRAFLEVDNSIYFIILLVMFGSTSSQTVSL